MAYLNPSVTAQVEVELGGVRDADVNCGTRRDVATLADLQPDNLQLLKRIEVL